MKILGIETSCDETAAAVVVDGTNILSSTVASQVALHHPYGGVVPELASRKHVEAIAVVVRKAVNDADLNLRDLDGVAVTQGPGLIGALLVGFSFAKSLSYALDLPWIGVNHLEGHINSVFLTATPPTFPFVALLVSGGHTGIYHVTSHTDPELMGQTRDDAAGEAFDKVAKMLQLGYPGGGIIERLANMGEVGKINFPKSYLDKSKFDFSFSGIKTAVKRYIDTHAETIETEIKDIATGFQESVVEVLSYKAVTAARVKECRHIALVGGVAANGRLREKLRQDAALVDISVHIPPVSLCGDNAAMIAATGYHYLSRGKVSGFEADVYSRGKRS